MEKYWQQVYIYMDDSGKLSNYEKCCIYGGIVFLSKDEKDKFITQYRKIIKSIRCSECNQDNNNCNKKCPEIKNSMIKSVSNRRWIMNYIKKYPMFCSVIDNSKIKDYIMESKSSKGRYLDYAQKMLVKEIFLSLIKNNVINPNKRVRLTMYIDEQATKSNGYYNLKESIREEFLHGIVNYNYGVIYRKILYSDFEISIHYVNSKNNYAIQAADFVAGQSRNLYLKWLNDSSTSLDSLFQKYTYIKYLP